VQSKIGQVNKEEVWLLVLAAGFSRRMGKQKLLLQINRESLVRYIVKKFLGTMADGIVVVTNSEYKEVKLEVEDLPVVVLENHHSIMGMSSSLKVGIEYLKDRKAGAAVVLLADQPTIDIKTINMMIKQHKRNKYQILQTNYKTKPSHPVLFSHLWFDELLEISGDKGAKNVLKKNRERVHMVNVDLPAPRDIDTVSEYEGFLEWSKHND
jgi:molybdenum cofactor cytidylyltransferase